jgi:hypothetical protein
MELGKFGALSPEKTEGLRQPAPYGIQARSLTKWFHWTTRRIVLYLFAATDYSPTFPIRRWG